MTSDTRIRILEAAKEIISERTKVHGVVLSLDSVASRVGLTKPGLMYHFPTKKALIVGLVKQTTEYWQGLLHDFAGAAPENLSVFDRYTAYVNVATTEEISRADFWIFSDAIFYAELAEIWKKEMTPWFEFNSESKGVRGALTAARFCADGAWMSGATGVLQAENLSDVRLNALALIEKAKKEA